MTDKERLEDIKERFMKYEYDYNLSGEDVEWLIEQAKRVEKLETQYERYKQALEEIRGLYPLRNVGYQVSEIRKIVIKALEVTEK